MALRSLALLVAVVISLSEARLAHSGVKGDHDGKVLAASTVPKLPEQGYEGKDVKHENFKSITKDWGAEYGPTTVAPPAAHRSFTTRSAGVLLPAVAALVALWM